MVHVLTTVITNDIFMIIIVIINIIYEKKSFF